MVALSRGEAPLYSRAMWARKLAPLAAFIALCFGAALAWAGTPVHSDPEGKAGGLVYRSGSQYFAGSGAVVASCPKGRHITGGGATLDGDPEFGELAYAGPDHEGPGVSSREAYAAHGYVSGLGQTLKSYAICTKSASLIYRLKKPVVSATGPLVTKVRCPRGASVVGGGFDSHANDDGALISAPFDGSDPDDDPDDGWSMRVIATDLFQTVHVTAVCSSDLHLAYREQTATASGDLATSAVCPSNAVVTGGGAELSGDAGAHLTNSAPADFGDADNTTPEDAWATKAHVDAGSRDLTAYAICKR
jgi:hypothetical protein